MNNIALTRWLYILDEVYFTLLESLIKSESFNMVIFWAGEIHYSGFTEQLWQFIFEFNYNFCAVTYPKFEKKLYKLYRYSQETEDTSKKFNYTLSALTIIFNSEKTYLVFDHWNNNPKSIDKVYLGRKPVWFNKLNIDKKYYIFLKSIETKNFINIIFLLKTKKYNYNELYNVIKKYFNGIQKINISSKNIDLNELPYKNKEHIILSMIIHMFIDENSIEKRSIFIACDHDEYKDIIAEDNKLVKPAYKTLPQKYKYKISNNIGCFPLSRFSLSTLTLQEIYWYYWEYFAYRSPLWKERFDKYDIVVDHDTYKITFKNDLEYEEFSEKYYYETDEQSKYIQNHAIDEIKKITFETWKTNNKF